jgi:hypothetical protein
MFLSRDPWSGDELQSLSHNGWLYVEGNPVKYRDPSGLITQDEATRPGGADEIVNELKPYGITIYKDWGIDYEPWVGGCRIWMQGAWKYDDLVKVKAAIHIFDDARFFFGAARFSRAIQGHALIFRWNDDSHTSFAPPGVLREAAGADVVLTNYPFTNGPQPEYPIYQVIHELGHVWDHRTGNALSKGLMIALNTWYKDKAGWHWDPYRNNELPPGADPTCTVNEIRLGICAVPYAFTYGVAGDRVEGPGWEDWAESFASYIYPNYHDVVGQTNLDSSATRKWYVRTQISNVH